MNPLVRFALQRPATVLFIAKAGYQAMCQAEQKLHLKERTAAGVAKTKQKFAELKTAPMKREQSAAATTSPMPHRWVVENRQTLCTQCGQIVTTGELPPLGCAKL